MAGPFGALLPFDPAALAAQGRPDLTPQQESLTQYDPTIRDRLAAAVLGNQPSPLAIDMTKRLLGSAGAGNSGFSAVDLTPAGIPLAIDEAAKAGDPQAAAMAVLPIPGARGAGGYAREIRPAGENLKDLIDANFNHAKVIGDKLVPTGWLKGGVGQSVDDAARVSKLKDKIAAPDGYVERLVVDDAGNVIEGQHRLDALRAMGEKSVPVTVIGDLTRGHDYDAARAALKDSKLHPDQQHQLLGRVFETIHAEKGKIAGARDYDVPGFNREYQTVLDTLEPPKAKASPEALPMDEASRMARAKAQGFDVENPIYHGTSKDKDFSKFKDSRHGTWSTTDPAGASMYAAENDSKNLVYEGGKFVRVNEADRVLPMYAKPLQKPFIVGPDDIPESVRNASNYKKAQSDWFDSLRRQGYDGVQYNDGVRVDFNNANLRSKFAKFDPKNIGKAGLAGSVAAFGLMPNLEDR